MSERIFYESTSYSYYHTLLTIVKCIETHLECRGTPVEEHCLETLNNVQHNRSINQRNGKQIRVSQLPVYTLQILVHVIVSLIDESCPRRTADHFICFPIEEEFCKLIIFASRVCRVRKGPVCHSDAAP